jgi:CBS domain-containing protein
VPDTAVLAAMHAMADKHFGFLPVIENGVMVDG